jgi:uncharacterized protein YndB with AHSA1/START domain
MVDKVREDIAITLPSDTQVVITRRMKAPRNLVFEAFTKAEHLRNWWGCRQFTVAVCEVDFRVGGEWRITQRSPDGHEHPFRGVYREIARPEKLEYTFIYDVDFIRDHPAVESVTFEERDGWTTLTNTITHGSKAARDGHLQSGMEAGARECMDRLEELVESWR